MDHYNGAAWRSHEPLDHDRGTTIQDVIDYEQTELGNQLDVDGAALAQYGEEPARRLIWITRTRAPARRYGTPYQIAHLRGIIIARDGDNGLLIMQDGAAPIGRLYISL